MTTTTTRPSSDFSSIGPSQPASQATSNHTHEEHPPDPAAIHSVMNTPAFGELVSPSIATTTTIAASAPPAESNTSHPRPLSGNSIATTTGSSIRYSIATLAAYTLETVTYVQAIPLSSGAVVTKPKPKKKRTHSSSVARSESPYAPISYAMFKDGDLHATIPCAACD